MLGSMMESSSSSSCRSWNSSCSGQHKLKVTDQVPLKRQGVQRAKRRIVKLKVKSSTREEICSSDQPDSRLAIPTANSGDTTRSEPPNQTLVTSLHLSPPTADFKSPYLTFSSFSSRKLCRRRTSLKTFRRRFRLETVLEEDETIPEAAPSKPCVFEDSIISSSNLQSCRSRA